MKVYSKRDNIAIFHILNNYYLSYIIRPVFDRPFAFFDKLKNKTDTYRLNKKMGTSCSKRGDSSMAEVECTSLCLQIKLSRRATLVN